MYDILKESIRPELLVLVPVMYIIGMVLKQSKINDKYIPILLGAFSIIMSFIWLLAISIPSNIQEILSLIFMGLTQGILIAGASVYINQIIKQQNK